MVWRWGLARNERVLTTSMAFGLCCGLLFVGGACETLEQGANPERVSLLQGNELTVVMSRLGTRPGQIVTAAEGLKMRVYLDPELADLGRVASYRIWSRNHEPESGKTDAWEKLADVSKDETTPALWLPEGVVGLRASVVNRDGTETLVPRGSDDPAVWLLVDRSAPDIFFIAPAKSSSVLQFRNINLEWRGNETRFGDVPYRLSWSADEGKTWEFIASVPASPGDQKFRWWLPSEAVGNLIVRVEAEDFAGHRARAELPLVYYPSPQLQRPEEAGDPQAQHEARPIVAEAGGRDDFATEHGGVVKIAYEEPLSDAGTSGGGASEDWASAGVPLPPNLQHDEAVHSLLEAAKDGDVADEPAPGTAMSATVVRDDGSDLLPAESAHGDVMALEPIPPRVDAVEVPPVAGPGGLRISLTIEDTGGLGVETVEVYVRARERGRSQWARVPPGRAYLDGSSLTVNLDGFPEAEYDIYLRPVDRAGTAGPAPGASVVSSGRFRLDRTPPKIRLRSVSTDWVAGFRAEVQVDAGAEYASGPDRFGELIVAGRQAGGWREIGRWQRLPPGGKVSFVVPLDLESYSIRASLEDPAGNRGTTVLGPRLVQSAIRFATFREPAEYAASGVAEVQWDLHPVAAAHADQLTVGVFHQAGEGDPWNVIFENVEATASNYWDLPPADNETHRLRLQLLRGDQVVGERFSAPFTLKGRDVPTMVSVSQGSRDYYEQGRSQMERYRAALADHRRGVRNDEELASLERSVVRAYRKAIDTDSRNYQAVYSLAQFLNRVDSERHAEEVRSLLERSIEVKPDYFWALNDLGAVYIQEGNFSGAERVLARAVEVQPGAIVRYNLALALFYQEEMARAREHFQLALDSGGGQEVPEGEIYYYYVHSYLQEGNYDSARDLLRQKGNLIPQDLRQELESSL